MFLNPTTHEVRSNGKIADVVRACGVRMASGCVKARCCRRDAIIGVFLLHDLDRLA